MKLYHRLIAITMVLSLVVFSSSFVLQPVDGSIEPNATNKDIKEAYSFDYEIKMTMNTTDKNGKSQAIPMTLMYPENGGFVGAEVSMKAMNGISIMDMSEKKMIVIMASRAMVMDMDKFNQMGSKMMGTNSQEVKEKMKDFSIEKTGKTKNVAGYTCKQFLIDNESVEMEMWVTNDLPFNVTESLMGMQKTMSLDYDLSQIDGFPLEIHSTDKETGEEYSMTTQSVGKTSKSFNLANYELMDMSNMGGNK